jgi:hypothetical protein
MGLIKSNGGNAIRVTNGKRGLLIGPNQRETALTVVVRKYRQITR